MMTSLFIKLQEIGDLADMNSVATAAARIWLSAISQPQADVSRIKLATASAASLHLKKAYVSRSSGFFFFFESMDNHGLTCDK